MKGDGYRLQKIFAVMLGCFAYSGFVLAMPSGLWVEFSLRPDVQLHQPIVRFGDIADIRSNHAALTYQLANQAITYLSPAQPERRLDILEIEGRLGMVRKNQHIRWQRQVGSADQVIVRWQQTSSFKTANTSNAIVQRGQWFNLNVQHGDVQLQTPAQALQNGQPGQTIAVRTREGRGPVLARVEPSSSQPALPPSHPQFILTR